MAKSLEQTIQQIGDRLEKRLIPKLWRPSRDEIRALRDQLREIVTASLRSATVKRLIKQDMTDPKVVKRVGKRIKNQARLKIGLQAAVVASKLQLVDLKKAATPAVYESTTESLANVLNANSPDGVTIFPVMRKEDLARVRDLPVAGLLYADGLRPILDPIPEDIRGRIIDAVIRHGNSTLAGLDILSGIDGMMRRIEDDTLRLFSEHMLAVDQQAEIDARVPVPK